MWHRFDANCGQTNSTPRVELEPETQTVGTVFPRNDESGTQTAGTVCQGPREPDFSVNSTEVQGRPFSNRKPSEQLHAFSNRKPPELFHAQTVRGPKRIDLKPLSFDISPFSGFFFSFFLFFWATPPVRLGLSGGNSRKFLERPRKRSQSFSWNSP